MVTKVIRTDNKTFIFDGPESLLCTLQDGKATYLAFDEAEDGHVAAIEHMRKNDLQLAITRISIIQRGKPPHNYVTGRDKVLVKPGEEWTHGNR